MLTAQGFNAWVTSSASVDCDALFHTHLTQSLSKIDTAVCLSWGAFHIIWYTSNKTEPCPFCLRGVVEKRKKIQQVLRVPCLVCRNGKNWTTALVKLICKPSRRKHHHPNQAQYRS